MTDNDDWRAAPSGSPDIKMMVEPGVDSTASHSPRDIELADQGEEAFY